MSHQVDPEIAICYCKRIFQPPTHGRVYVSWMLKLTWVWDQGGIQLSDTMKIQQGHDGYIFNIAIENGHRNSGFTENDMGKKLLRN